MRHQELQLGFTLIEVLVSIALLIILTVVLTATLTGSLDLNRQSQQQLSASTGSQQAMESVRNTWASQANYDNACAPGVILPDGYTAKFINLSSRGEPLSGASTNALPTTCATSGTSTTSLPTMRRIIISSGSTLRDTTLTLDVLRPKE